jgi:hypothetical protein
MPKIYTPYISLKMVENSIKNTERYASEKEFYLNLPKQIPYSTFQRMLKHLESMNKIMLDKDGSIIWIFVDSEKARKSLEESVPLI